MDTLIILASGSRTRHELLLNAGVKTEVVLPKVDEDAIKAGLQLEGASPREVADTLAEAKAKKVSGKYPDALVLGCDQVLDFKGTVFSKACDVDQARSQLMALRGQRHMLLSAAVICQAAKPIWRHVGVARLQMKDFSEDYLDDYLSRNWESVRDSVGCYKLEAEGIRLFSKVDGDYFTILGLPLIELLAYLTVRGEIKG